MKHRLRPDKTAPSVFQIDYGELKQAGYTCILFDIDNTLAHDGAPTGPRAKILTRWLQSEGFAIILISNARETRVRPFASSLGVKYIANAGKPKQKAYQKAIQMANVKSDQIVAIGDQLFTDIMGANRAGIQTILTQPLNQNEPWCVRLKRPLEHFILRLMGIKIDRRRR